MDDRVKLEIILAAKNITAKAFGDVDASITKLSRGVTTLSGALAAVGAGVFMDRIIETASVLQEAESKFDVVFQGQTRRVSEWVGVLTNAYAMSERESFQYLSSIQDLLVPMGMAADEAANLSNEVVKLAADLGSFNNQTTSKVMDDYQSALVGNYETMKKYGVVLNETTVKEKALAMGLAKTKDELTAGQKAQAAHQIIMESSAAAIGDMKRTSDGYANTTKRLSAEWEDFSAVLGEKFLPAASRIKGVTADILNNLTNAIKGPDLDEQINSVQARLNALMLSQEEKEKQFEAGRLAAIERREQRKKAWAKRNAAPENSESAKILAANQARWNEELKKSSEQLQIEAAQAELMYLMDLKHFQEEKSHIETLESMRKAAADEEQRRIEKEKKARKELNDLAEKAFSDWWDNNWSMSGYSEDDTFNRLLKEDLEAQNKLKDESKDFFKGITENFTETVQSGVSGVFSDAIKDDLDTSLDYIRTFSNTASDIVGAGITSSIMDAMSLLKKAGAEKDPKTAETLFSAASSAGYSALGFGVAGLGLLGINSMLNSRAKKKAEEERKANLRAQLQDELGDALAGLKLSDTGYAVYQLDARLKKLTASAIDSGYAMDEIIELRKLETKSILDEVAAKYKSVTNSATDWLTGIQREGWGVADWMNEQTRLYADLAALDQDSKDYQDESVTILNDILGTIQSTYQIQKEQLSSMTSTSKSLEAQIWDLNHGDGMAISPQDYMDRYDKLLAAANAENDDGFHSASAIADYQSFVTDYKDVLGGMGYDYASMIGGITADLGNIYDDVNSEMVELKEAIVTNTTSLGDDTTGVTGAIKTLTDVTQDLADRELYSQWRKMPPDVGSIAYSGATLPGYIFKDGTAKYTHDQRTLMETEGLRVQSIDDWIGTIDPSISDNFSAYLLNKPKDPYPSLTGGFATTRDMDLNDDGITTQSEVDKYVADKNKYYEALVKWVEGIPAFEYGGLANSPSIFGEKGIEWALPAYGNPRNENFLKSVGMDRVISSMAIDYDRLGMAVAKYMAPALAQLGNSSFEGKIDEKVLIKWFQKKLDSNGDLVRSVQIAAGVR